MQRMSKQRVSALMALGFMAVTMLMAGPAQAASGNGPYYAEPAWSQKLPVATRFVVLTDWNSEAVLDRNTGLVWERSPDTFARSWSDAKSFCANRSTGGQKGWRLPSMPELASLIDPSVEGFGLTLPAGHPFVGLLAIFYWSATTLAENPTNAWRVLFLGGLVATIDKATNGHVWCVRGGGPLSAY